MTEDQVKQAQDMAFGDALSELESIVAALESGTLDLEDSMRRYERGVKLLRVLEGRLAEAEQKVSMLVGELEGDGSEADADGS